MNKNFDQLLTNVLHLNIRSLLNKSEELSDLIDEISFNFDVIGICETWLNNENDHLINIQNYVFKGKHRVNQKGGGVGFYLRENLNFIIRNDLNKTLQLDFETYVIELINKKLKNFIIVISYRPPAQNVDIYLENLDSLLVKISNENKGILLMGDFNIDCGLVNSKIPDKFFQILSTYGLTQLITIPTRISTNRKSIIDNFFINEISDIKLCGTFSCDISDHQPSFLVETLNKSKSARPASQLAGKYSFSTQRIMNLNKSLYEENWHNIIMCENVNDAFNGFIDTYQGYFNKHCLVTSRKKISQMQKTKAMD